MDDPSCSQPQALKTFTSQAFKDRSLHHVQDAGAVGRSESVFRNNRLLLQEARPNLAEQVRPFTLHATNKNWEKDVEQFFLEHPPSLQQQQLGKQREQDWVDGFHQHHPPSITELHPDEILAYEQAFAHPPSFAPSFEQEAFEQAFANVSLEQNDQQLQKHWEDEFSQLADKPELLEQSWQESKDDSYWNELFQAQTGPSQAGQSGIITDVTDLPAMDQLEKIWQRDAGEDEWKLDGGDEEMLLDPSVWDHRADDEFNNITEEVGGGEYEFELENPFLTHADPLGEALTMKEKQDLPGRIALAYEAALQSEEHNQDATIWQALGETQAENEMEVAAIRALRRAVELDNKNALLSLAVCYINEGQDLEAFHSLESWIKLRNPDLYDNMAIPLRERIIDYYLTAARHDQEKGGIDADVQMGLGVLLYSQGDYDKAVDCFSAALQVLPKGATLANSGRSEDAISAYFRALDLKPTFVRARYNIGVSCTNIHCYREAAEHFLTAISMQQKQRSVNQKSSSQQSSGLWTGLRRVLYLMDRRDLAELAIEGCSDLEVFKKEFDF